MRHVLLGLLLVGAGSLVGCSSTGDTSANGGDAGAEAVDTGVSEGASATGASQGGAASAESMGTATYTGHPLDNPESILAKKVVYFDFDKSNIHDEDKAILDAHADYLVANGSASMRLEGHADERGTREYNVALGERRAVAVYRYMRLKGVAAEQMDYVSYGEERPAMQGHDESAWSKNRRVELIYKSR